MGAAQVAGVAGVAAAIELRRALDHDDAAAGARGGDRGAQRGIAAAGHHHVEGFVEIEQRRHDVAASSPTPPLSSAGRCKAPPFAVIFVSLPGYFTLLA